MDEIKDVEEFFEEEENKDVICRSCVGLGYTTDGTIKGSSPFCWIKNKKLKRLKKIKDCKAKVERDETLFLM